MSIVSGSNTVILLPSHYQKKDASTGTTVEPQDGQLGKGLEEILKSSVLSDMSSLPAPGLERQSTSLSV